mgnify:CR=1 FL=1
MYNFTLFLLYSSISNSIDPSDLVERKSPSDRTPHSKSKVPRKQDLQPVGKRSSLNKLTKNQRNCESAKASRLKRNQEFNDLEKQVSSALHLTQDELKIQFNQYYDKFFPSDSSDDSHHVKLARGRGRPKQLAKMTPEERAAEQLLIKKRDRDAAKRFRKKKKIKLAWLQSQLKP